MKRTVSGMAAAACALALVLAGCGNETAGTPQQGQASGTLAAPTAPTGPSSDSAPTGGSTGGEVTDATDETSTDETSTGEETTGGGTGTADETSVAWFDTFCGSLGPVKDLSTIGSEIDQSDPMGSLKKIAPKLTAAGESVTAGVEKLKGLPAPTFEGGEEYASTVVSSLDKIGPALTELGQKLSAGDTSGLADLASTLQGAAKPLQEIRSLPAEGQAALAQAPNCRTLGGS